MSAPSGPSPSYDDTGSSDSAAGSPNTAMIILYSITGIITVLFLVIIITGAVRAHRHPERYGPRYRSGRTRQSRARGIARAMLETIPIVKFGDEEQGSRRDSMKGDVEMLDPETGDDERDQQQQDRNKSSTQETVQTTATTTDPASDATATEEKRKSAAPSTKTPGHDTGNFSCPICTDDFIKGQDLRVLPCNHKFHPECIDPWLVNVSGTCPLCRIDLNPPQEQQEHEAGHEGTATDSPIEAPQPVHDPTHQHQHQHHHSHDRSHSSRPPRRLTGFIHHTLNVRRMRDATVEERLAALRSVREESTRNPTSTQEVDDQRRRNRLSMRLRERLRIGSRETDPATPTSPTPTSNTPTSGAATPANPTS